MQKTSIADPAPLHLSQAHGLPGGLALLGGKITLDTQIGAGGFGITYLARDMFLDRAVVVKECFPESICSRFGHQVTVADPAHQGQFRTIVDMFLREARSLARLRHPHIVSVHQAFEENGTAYMVLDLCEGRDLLDVIEGGGTPLTPDQVHDMLVNLLDAIEVVHQHDLLHRDISPDNILLDQWGSPALIDFGAAREDASKKTAAVSKMLVVKDGYSPHELYVSGGAQGAWSDIYALGATMYHLITGAAPVDSQERVSALAAQRDDPLVPLKGRFTQYPAPFLAAIDQAMSLSPKERFQTAAGWRAHIDQPTKDAKPMVMGAAKPLARSISELIEKTNSALTDGTPDKSRAGDKQTKTRIAEQTYRPEWVDEFNRETVEVAERKRRAAERAAAQEAAEKAEAARLARLERLAAQSQPGNQRWRVATGKGWIKPGDMA